jgi:hypothetical protein
MTVEAGVPVILRFHALSLVTPHSRTAGVALLLLAAGALTGCNGPDLDTSFKQLFERQRTPQQNMLVAVSDPDPDVRRSAAAQLASSDQVSKDWAITGLSALALLESNSQTRCVAIRGLARSNDPRAVEACLKVLNHGSYPPREVRAPDALVRWDAALALTEFSERGVVPEKNRAAVRDTLLERLRNDDSRHVRLAAARGLACYAERVSVEGLVRALRDSDFTVAATAARSLRSLTGVDLGSDAYAWSTWLEEHPEPSLAVNMPVKPRAWWQQIGDGTQDVFKWLFPGPKAR